MKFIFNFILIVCLWFSSAVHAAQNDAVHECGNLHSLEFKNIPNAEGLYSNENCMLKCSIGNATLSNDAINEGFPCPLDINGICHNGLCIGTQNDALRECGNLLHIDFHKTASRGTTYLNDQCTLRCVAGGQVVKEGPINEGYQCPLDPTGICRSGKCDKIVAPVTQAPTVQPTTSAPYLFLTHKIDQVTMTVLSANLTKAYTSLEAITCFEEIITKNSIDLLGPMSNVSHCKKACTTEQVNGKTAHALWHETPCVATGTFTDHDYITIELTEYGSLKSWVGTINLHLLSLVDYDYHKSGLHLPIELLTFTRKDLGLYNNRSVVGKMDIKFEVKLSPKN